MQTHRRTVPARLLHSPQTLIENRLAFAVSFIRAQLHRHISIDELAKKCCVSKPQFFRHFKNEFGLTPLEFINSERINFAKKLLLESSLNIGDAAFQSGFNNPNYFIKVFKGHVGLTPKAFQRRRETL
jgi:AraC-like DNA-binding protein